MILSAVLAFSLFVCLSTSSHGHSDIGGMVEVDDARENKDEPSFAREKRGLTLAELGVAALKRLLRGTKYVRQSSGHSLYEKKGKFKDALRDFNAVVKSEAQSRPIRGGRGKWLVGTVGDRKIQLMAHTSKNFGQGADVILLVSNPKRSELPYKVVYKKQL